MKSDFIFQRIKFFVRFIINAFMALFFMFIIALHAYVPFFPVLFLFDICFWIGYPLFLRYIIKKTWSVCVRDERLSLKYITIPCLIMELIVMFCYPQETMMLVNMCFE